MALQQTINYKGLSITDAYIRITSLSIGLNNLPSGKEYVGTIQYSVGTTQESEPIYFDSTIFVVDANIEQAIFQQAYDYLKNNVFIQATDI